MAIVSSVATWLTLKLADKGFDLIIEDINKSKTNIDKIFRKKIKLVSDKIEKEYPNVLGNDVQYYFLTPYVFDELIKLLFVNQKIDQNVIEERFDTETIPTKLIEDFITLLKAELNRDINFVKILADKEIYLTLSGIENAIDSILLNSNLQLNETVKIVNLLRKRLENNFDVELFLSKYLKILENNIRTLNHIGLGVDQSIKRGKTKDLAEIFVAPNFVMDSNYYLQHEHESGQKYDGDIIYSENIFEEQKTIIEFNNLFTRSYNYIILGNPGAGKSLLLKSILLALCNDRKIKLNTSNVKNRIPFRIELKNYLAYKKQFSGNIIKYLIFNLENEYLINNLLISNIEIILNQNETLFLFDGLDEIFDLNDKIEIKQDIDNFVKTYDKSRSIVTSRFIGYNEVKFDEKTFCELSILPFNNKQITEYVNKWYLLEEPNKGQREVETSDFILKMSNVDNELLSNPLLLSLIVILYRNNLKIPESKLEIYQSCTHTLVDKWDAIKNLEIDFDKKILHKKEPILSDLAYWQYRKLSSTEPKISYYQVKSIIAESLIKKNLADEEDAFELAESFLEYIQKRSIYFDNNFTHKTFLEYYTAYWLYSNIEKKHKTKERNAIIAKYIDNPFWTIVLELFLNLIDKDQPDTEILDDIIKINCRKNSSLYFLLYMVPNLKNISKATTYNLLQTTISHLSTQKFKTTKLNSNLLSRLNNLFSDDRINEILDQVFASYDTKESFILQAELLFNSHRNNSSEKIWESLIKRENFQETMISDHHLYQLVLFYEIIYESNFSDYENKFHKYISTHGTKMLFIRNKPWYFMRSSFPPIFYAFWRAQTRPDNINQLEINLKKLLKYGVEPDAILFFLTEHIFHIDRSMLNMFIKKYEESKEVFFKRIYFVLILDSLELKDFLRLDSIDFDKLNVSTELKNLLIRVEGFDVNNVRFNNYIKRLVLKIEL